MLQINDNSEVVDRPHSTGMDSLVGLEFKVLDKGFVRVVDYLGNDESVVRAARVSYGSGTSKTSTDRALIRYLMRHRHTTPFEMCELVVHVKLPLFVARQWVRHRTANVNEYSARYSVLDKDFYVPLGEHIAKQSTDNKQGRGQPFDDRESEFIRRQIYDVCDDAYDTYEDLLDKGVSRELARMVLPTNIYTQWYWKTDLHNLFHFLSLRQDSHAQYEIRAYADVLAAIIEHWCPISYLAYKDYIRDAATFSGPEMDCIRGMIGGNFVKDKTKWLSAREEKEFMGKLRLCQE